jgi:hypothetical protein
MILTQDSLPTYFTIANPDNSWYKEPTNTFNFIGNNSRTLVVTIGDSYTWGSDISQVNRDDNFRIENVYGRIVSRELDSDWLNLGLCAQGNFWIADMVKELSIIISKLEYDKIYVICTFTGVGRWFNTKFDRHINYIKWFKDNISQADDFNKLFVMLNSECIDSILKSLDNFPDVTLKIGTNFVDQIGFDKLLPNQNLSTPWYKLMDIDDNQTVFACLTYERLSMATDFLDSKYHSTFKLWFLEQSKKINLRFNLLNNSMLFRNYHPLAPGHKIWANYILENLNI